MKSVIDVVYHDHLNIQNTGSKYIIPGGYVKKLPSTTTDYLKKPNEAPIILYVPSVFSPELKQHNFHLYGPQILKILAQSFPHVSIICRPHPTDVNRDYIKEAVYSLAKYQNVTFDLKPNPDPNLYAEPNIVITDMSGFAFTHEFVTTRRPIFLFNKLISTDIDRFAQLAATFGDIAIDFDELIWLVEKKLNLNDSLKVSEAKIFRNLFLDDSNNPDQLVRDLMDIKNHTSNNNWIKIPFLFDSKKP